VRAAVAGTGRNVRVADIERPAPALGEVLIDVACCGVCGSDLHSCPSAWLPPGTCAHLAAGSIPCDKIITAIVPLADVPSLISDLQAAATEQVKVLLAPGQPAD
jgi:threonine dehydrogenase-like Zn-dependent dehydrogenase